MSPPRDRDYNRARTSPFTFGQNESYDGPPPYEFWPPEPAPRSQIPSRQTADDEELPLPSYFLEPKRLATYATLLFVAAVCGTFSIKLLLRLQPVPLVKALFTDVYTSLQDVFALFVLRPFALARAAPGIAYGQLCALVADLMEAAGFTYVLGRILLRGGAFWLLVYNVGPYLVGAATRCVAGILEMWEQRRARKRLDAAFGRYNALRRLAQASHSSPGSSGRLHLVTQSSIPQARTSDDEGSGGQRGRRNRRRR